MLEERMDPIKPMTVSEILDNTFKIYGRNFLAILLFSALIGGVFSLISTYTAQKAMPMDMSSAPWTDLFNDPENLPDIGAGDMEDMMADFFELQSRIFLLSLIGGIFVRPFIQGGIVNIAYRDISGKRMRPGEAFRSGLKNFGKWILTGLSLIPYYIGVGIVVLIVSVIALMPLIFSGAALGGDPTGGKVAGFVLMLVLTIGVIVLLALSAGTFIIFTYQATTEGKYGFSAIGRSFKLVAKKFGRVLGVSLLMYIIMAIMGSILSMISGVTSILSPTPLMGNYAVGFVMSAFVTPILYIAITLLFLDTKARVEGPREEIVEE